MNCILSTPKPLYFVSSQANITTTITTKPLVPNKLARLEMKPNRSHKVKVDDSNNNDDNTNTNTIIIILIIQYAYTINRRNLNPKTYILNPESEDYGPKTYNTAFKP